MAPARKPNPDFDFLMGIWNCRHRYLVRRLADCHDWIEFDGPCAARKILDGFGNIDEGDINLPGDRYRGAIGHPVVTGGQLYVSDGVTLRMFSP